jgi:hypothetical protein
MATAREIRRAEEELGYEVEEDWLDNLLDQYESWSMKELRAELRDLEDAFAKRGGRGVDLADEIDALRVVIAVRRR